MLHGNTKGTLMYVIIVIVFNINLSVMQIHTIYNQRECKLRSDPDHELFTADNSWELQSKPLSETISSFEVNKHLNC